MSKSRKSRKKRQVHGYKHPHRTLSRIQRKSSRKIHTTRPRNHIYQSSMYRMETKERTSFAELFPIVLLIVALISALVIVILCGTFGKKSHMPSPSSNSQDTTAYIIDGALTINTMEFITTPSAVLDQPPSTGVTDALDVQPMDFVEPTDHQHNGAFRNAKDLPEYNHLESYRDNYRVCGQPEGAPGTILVNYYREDINDGHTLCLVSIPELPDELKALTEEYHYLLLYNELSGSEVGEYRTAQLVFYEHDIVIDSLLCRLDEASLSDDQSFIIFETRYLNSSKEPGHFMSTGKIYSAEQHRMIYHEMENIIEDSEGETTNICLDQYTSTTYTPTADHLSLILSDLS